MKFKDDTFISIDIETTGPCPGYHSILSLGAAVIVKGEIVETGYWNFTLPFEHRFDKDTLEFWEENKKAFLETRENVIPVAQGFYEFMLLVKKHPNSVLAAYPSGFDYSWIYYIYHSCKIEHSEYEWPNLGFTCLDIKTLAAVKLDRSYKKCSKSKFPKKFKEGLEKHTHNALDDAIEQAQMLINILNYEQ